MVIAPTRGTEFSKNTLLAIEQFRSDVARRRQRWRGEMDKRYPERLVFIDETWIRTDMAPIRGWAPKGKRLKGYAPTVAGRSTRVLPHCALKR